MFSSQDNRKETTNKGNKRIECVLTDEEVLDIIDRIENTRVKGSSNQMIEDIPSIEEIKEDCSKKDYDEYLKFKEYETQCYMDSLLNHVDVPIEEIDNEQSLEEFDTTDYEQKCSKYNDEIEQVELTKTRYKQLSPIDVNGKQQFNDHKIKIRETLKKYPELVGEWRNWLEEGDGRDFSDILLPYWFPYKTTREDIDAYLSTRSELKDYFYESWMETGASMEMYTPGTVQEYEALVNEAYGNEWNKCPPGYEGSDYRDYFVPSLYHTNPDMEIENN